MWGVKQNAASQALVCCRSVPGEVWGSPREVMPWGSVRFDR